MQNRLQPQKVKSNMFLEKIVAKKKFDLSQIKLRFQNIDTLDNQTSRKSDTSCFLNIFREGKNKISLIAEIKFSSPTNPTLGSHADFLGRVIQYESAGADAISIITEKHFFKGDISSVSQIKKEVSLPILQKDFVIDPIQIYEAKNTGSDALLLIARLVSSLELKNFVSLCFSLGIEPVVEINSEEDLEKAVDSGTNIIAVNARDLETFTIDLNKACLLIQKIPEHFIKLGFSGINSENEVLQYKKAGAKGVLVGTSLMMTNNIKNFIKSLQL